MTDSTTPFEIHSLTLAGLLVVTRANTEFTPVFETLFPGDVLTVTPEIYELNSDRFGDTWLAYSPERQLEVWGEQRFGLGPVPETLTRALNDQRLAALAEERDRIVRLNPSAAIATEVTKRIAAIDAELSR